MMYDAKKDPSAEIVKVMAAAPAKAAPAKPKTPAKAAPAKAVNPNFYESESIKKMPDWIRCGCGDAPYYCEEKKATFGGKDGVTPQKMPDLSKKILFSSTSSNHSSFSKR